MGKATVIARVAVVGAGTIGASWAAFYLAKGFDVVVTDPGENVEKIVRRAVEQAWPALTRLGNVVASATPDRMRFEPNLRKALKGAQFVQENGPERLDLKVTLLAQIDSAVDSDVIIASSTSGLLMSDMQRECSFPQRCVIGHPFNPPHLIPLVEVVGGNLTSPEAVARTMDFYRALGKHPIQLKREIPGHIANRLQAAVWREAIHLVAEGIVTVADLDTAMTQGPGLRWALNGPHQTFHLGGGTGGLTHFMAHILGPMQVWWDDLGAPDITEALQARLRAGVEAQAAGRSVAELAAERDDALIRVILARERPESS